MSVVPKAAVSAWAKARFSSGEGVPSNGTSGSPNTRAARISVLDASREKRGCVGGGATTGTLRFTSIGGGADVASRALKASAAVGAGASAAATGSEVPIRAVTVSTAIVRVSGCRRNVSLKLSLGLMEEEALTAAAPRR
jgi:hypothetical protein